MSRTSWRIRQAGREGVLFRLQLGPAVGQGTVPATLLDDAHDFGSGLFYVGKLAASGSGCAAALG